MQITRCADALGMRRSGMRMLGENELIDVVGYPRGSIGPIGSRRPATVSQTLVPCHIILLTLSWTGPTRHRTD